MKLVRAECRDTSHFPTFPERYGANLDHLCLLHSYISVKQFGESATFRERFIDTFDRGRRVATPI